MKIIKNNYKGPIKTVCPECTSILEVERSDIIEVSELDTPNPADYRAAYKYFICLCCKNEVIIIK